jgi:hypothetical protein
MKKKEFDEIQINNPLLRKSLERSPFLVPEGYFSTLKDEIKLKKRISELGESSFILPSAYHETLRQDILSKISENELKKLIPSKNPAVPSGYFEDLQERILSKFTKADTNDVDKGLKEPKKPIQKTPIRRLGIRKWMPYVAAASITIAIALFAILDGVKIPNGGNVGYSAQVKEIPTEEIINYLAYYSEAGDSQYLSEHLNDRSTNITDNIPSQEIEAYLEYGL